MCDKPDPALDMIRRHVNQLAEHFETVQIFVTKMDGEKTRTTQSGSGNWFARGEQVREWIIKRDELSRIQVREQNEE